MAALKVNIGKANIGKANAGMAKKEKERSCTYDF
jgi:hypothetical protein